jgi:GH25 family lysozyme M1 (1,4-beta-N-acetylmuramidase)
MMLANATAPALVEGFDVSKFQGPITTGNLLATRAAGKRFMMVRGWEGLSSTGDDRFAANVACAKSIGLPVGAYLVGHPNADPVKQAMLHFDGVKGLGTQPGEMYPALDLELVEGMSDLERLQWASEYIVAAEKLWGHAIQFYSYPNYLDALDKMGDTSALVRCTLWFAWYQRSLPTMPHGPWQKLGMWQSSGGTGPGAWHLPNGLPCDEDAIPDEATFQSLLVQPPGMANPLAGIPVPGLVVPGENA